MADALGKRHVYFVAEAKDLQNIVMGMWRVRERTMVAKFGRREYRICVIVDFMKPNKKVVAAIRR